MSKNVTPPLQFSLAELMGTVVMTFIGILLFERIMPLEGNGLVLFVIISTSVIAALATIADTTAAERRLWMLIDNFVMVWISWLSFFWLMEQSGEFFAWFLAIILPGSVAILIQFIFSPHQRFRVGR